MSFFGNHSGIYFRDNYRNIGTVNFSFKITPREKFSYGGTFTYESIAGDLNFYGKIKSYQKYSFYTAALEMDYYYASKDALQMYFTIGAGATFLHEDYRSYSTEPDTSNDGFYAPHPNFQLNLIGLKFGKKVAGFTEIGFGYKGLINAGLSLKLK